MKNYLDLCQKDVSDLKNKIVEGMMEVLKEKGYKPGINAGNLNYAYGGVTGSTRIEVDGQRIEWLSDRILVNGWCTELLSIEKLMAALRACYNAVSYTDVEF